LDQFVGSHGPGLRYKELEWLKLKAQSTVNELWLSALDSDEQLLVAGGQFGEAFIRCLRDDRQYAILLMENNNGSQRALLKVPLAASCGHKLYEFDPSIVTAEYVDGSGFCATDFERGGRANLPASRHFKEVKLPKGGGWKPLVFWIIAADNLLKFARFAEVIFYDGTFGVTNRNLLVMVPAALDCRRKHVAGGLIFFKSEDQQCCDFILLVAAVILLGVHLRRCVGLRTDGNAQLKAASLKGIALLLYGRGRLTVFWILCWASDQPISTQRPRHWQPKLNDFHLNSFPQLLLLAAS
jgi:hypothetical protein